MIDWLILSIALALAVFNRYAAIIAIWFGSSIALFWWYVGATKWSLLADWAFYSALKDFAIMALAGYIRAPLTITLGIAASCLFHQVLSWQINTYTWENVTLIEPRSGFMMFLAAGMLATAIIDMGGGTNGGRRAINYRFRFDGCIRSVLRVASQKVKQ